MLSTFLKESMNVMFEDYKHPHEDGKKCPESRDMKDDKKANRNCILFLHIIVNVFVYA